MVQEVSWLLDGCFSRRGVRAALDGLPNAGMALAGRGAKGQQEKDCPEQLMRDTLSQIDTI